MLMSTEGDTWSHIKGKKIKDMIHILVVHNNMCIVSDARLKHQWSTVVHLCTPVNVRLNLKAGQPSLYRHIDRYIYYIYRSEKN